MVTHSRTNLAIWKLATIPNPGSNHHRVTLQVLEVMQHVIYATIACESYELTTLYNMVAIQNKYNMQ